MINLVLSIVPIQAIELLIQGIDHHSIIVMGRYRSSSGPTSDFSLIFFITLIHRFVAILVVEKLVDIHSLCHSLPDPATPEAPSGFSLVTAQQKLIRIDAKGSHRRRSPIEGVRIVVECAQHISDNWSTL